ncbi:MAG: type II toxin-antitoxin system RelE/ParE family toxin [Brevundimonas sp.]
MTDDARLEFTARARRDLNHAKSWLTQPGSGRKAHNRYVAILRALLDLRRYPLRWPPAEHAGVRKLSVEAYIVLYEIDGHGEVVTVLRIFGPHQDLSNL